ncbi:MAG: hypothetical protein LBL07_13450 [Tannerella sp.]|nr:hypothetical protein [Tannerella sp.]
MKIKLFLTFDHELPLGGLRTTYHKALFEPTQRVLDTADRLGVKVTLFTDILCACRYREWDYVQFYAPYIQQLHDAIRTGHDVQLHIHPHWLTTGYAGGTFLPSTDFAPADFKDNASFGGIEGIIKLSVDRLNEICLAADAAYRCVACRAGGYNIYPETKAIFDALYRAGIRYDSSMARGYYFKSSLSEIDFRRLPSKPNWTVDPSNLHVAYSGDGILEIPIATIPKTPFELPTRFKQKRYAHRAVENRGHMIHSDEGIDLASKIRMLFAARMLSFDNHTLSPDYLLRIFRYQISRYKKSGEVMMSLISHPKGMGEYSFELMEKFISAIRKSYPDVEFATFTRLHNR